jgi:hypothetical protein
MSGILAEYYDERKLAAAFEVSVRTIKRWRADGSGPTWVRIGRKWIVSAEEVNRWLKSGGTVAGGKSGAIE